MPELEKLYLLFEGNPERMKCMFNPEQISFVRSNTWGEPPEEPAEDGQEVQAARPGRGVPTLEFGGAQSGSMSLDLIFDTTGTGEPVSVHTHKLLSKMEIDWDLPGSNRAELKGRPPWVRVIWGRFRSEPMVITQATVTFTYFSSSGVPLRANVSLSMMQRHQDKKYGAQNPTSGTPLPHRVHRVQPGETLDRISARYYGDSTKWRLLAAANGIEDPLGVRSGSLINIPQLGDR